MEDAARRRRSTEAAVMNSATLAEAAYDSEVLAAEVDEGDPADLDEPKVATKRPGALIWFLRKSRAKWKAKVEEVRVELKRMKNRVNDVTKSRDRYKEKAEEAARRQAELEGENARLHSEVQRLQREKKTRQAIRAAGCSIPAVK